MKIRSNLSAFIVFGVFVGVAAGQTPLIKRTTTKTDRLDFGVGGTVSITGAPNGSITVGPAAGNEIEITAEIEIQAPTEGDLERLSKVTGFVLQESMIKVGVVSTGVHDTKYIKRVDKKFPKELLSSPFRINYVIRVPRYCDLQIDGGTGDIFVTGIEGAIRVNSLEGDVRVDLVGGTFNGTFGKGPVSITIPNRSWRGGPIDAALASGEMDVYLPVNVSAELDASILRTGSINNEFDTFKPRTRTVKFTDTSIIARAGAGGVAMKFTVGDGKLRIRRLGGQNQ